MSDVKEWLTTRETMALLGISRTRLWQLVREGRLTPHQRGANRKLRYYRSKEVERLAAATRPALLHKQVDMRGEGK